MARNGRNMVIYEGTFVSNQSLGIFCKRLKYKIKPNYSKDVIRPRLAIFSVFLKKITTTE